ITGAIQKFAPHARIVHIDIDKSEHHKNKVVDYPVHSDVKHALARLNALMDERDFQAPDITAWNEQVYAWQKEYPFAYEETKDIQPQHAIDVLYQESGGDAIITTGVGQHQMWSAQFYKFH